VELLLKLFILNAKHLQLAHPHTEHGFHKYLTSSEHNVLGTLPNLDSFETSLFKIFFNLNAPIIILSEIAINVGTSKILLPFIFWNMLLENLVHDGKHDTLFSSSPNCESGDRIVLQDSIGLFNLVY